MISVFRTVDKTGRDSVAVVLSQDAMFVTAEGDYPYPGVALYAPQAREIAYRLLMFAQEIENGRSSGPLAGFDHAVGSEPETVAGRNRLTNWRAPCGLEFDPPGLAYTIHGVSYANQTCYSVGV
jgi:hypothetical protein